MMQKTDVNPELISALADGQLRGTEFDHVLNQLQNSDAARSTWHVYHVVGDVLRSGDAMFGSNDAEFLLRLRGRLQQETPVMSHFPELELLASDAHGIKGEADHLGSHHSANEAWFLWRRVVGVLSLAAVTLIGWQFGFGGASQEAPQLVQRPPVSGLTAASALAAGQAPVMIRDPQLDALLLAHRQFGGTSALQMPAGFVRNATFEGAHR
jgi:sigma-E factor negative regulatory protein RseA